MRKIIYLICASLSLLACQKGENVAPFLELANIYFTAAIKSDVQFYRNNELITKINDRNFKIPLGQAEFKFVNDEGKILLKETLVFDKVKDTVAFVDIGGQYLLLRSLTDIPVNPNKYKINFVNNTMAAKGQELTILAYRFNANTQQTEGEPETIKGVAAELNNTFWEIDLGGLAKLSIDETEAFPMVWFILDKNNQPYRKDGHPIMFYFVPPVIYGANVPDFRPQVHRVILTDNAVSSLGVFPIGPYPEGVEAFSVTVIQSK